jgi:signal transduction histidine kinase/ligand-binding sensor domain-containing protein/CheY-like chemotaxis protein
MTIRLSFSFLRAIAATLFCLFQAVAPATAADRWEPLATPIFELIGLEQGMPHPMAMALAQDGTGFVWAGTQGGLARWDGYRMRVFRHEPSDQHSLPSNFIQALRADYKGRLWIGTANAGMAMYDAATERFVRYPAGAKGLSHASVTAIAPDPRGGIWTGTASGLDYVNPDQEGVVHYLDGVHIRSLLVDRRGTLWVGTVTGLLRKLASESEFTAVTPAGAMAWNDSVVALAEDQQGRIAIGTVKSGLAVVGADGSSAKMLAAHGVDDAASYMTLAISDNGNGRWWVATYGGGILEIDPANGLARRIRHDALAPGSLAHDRTAAILRDRSGLLWLSTERGLNLYDPQSRALRGVFGGSGLSAADSTAAMFDAEGRMWVALAEKGIDLLDKEGRRRALMRPDPARPEHALPGRTIFSMVQQTGGSRDVWIGTQAGLYRSDRDGNRLTRIPLQLPDPFPRIATVVADGDYLWIGSAAGAVHYHITSGRQQSYSQGPAPGGLSDNRVESLAIGPEKSVWIGTRNGLNRLDPASGAIEQIPFDANNPEALSGGFVAGLAFDRSGRLWVGLHDSGINVMTGRRQDGSPRFRRINSASGLPSENTASIKADQRGRMWSASTDGVAVIDADTLAVRAIGRADGLPIRAYYVGAGQVSPDGEIIFLGSGGFTVIIPGALGNWTWRPPLAITAVRLGRKEIAAAAIGQPNSAPLTLTPDAKGLEVEFAALDYSAPAQNRYRYRLEGFDERWIDADSTRRMAVYTSLPPGDYRLHIQGSNRNGQWSDSQLDLPVRVLPAWYESVWALIAYVAAGLLLAWAAVKWQVARLEKEKQHLEDQVFARTSHLERMNAIVRSINQQLQFEPLLATMLREATIIQGVDRAYALVREHHSGAMLMRASWEREGRRFEAPALDTEAAHALLVDGAQVVSEDIFLSRDEGARLALRIGDGEQADGYLVFENRRDRQAFDASELSLLSALREHFVSAFQKAQALRQIDHARARAEAATRAKSEFLANITHEIRTPMNAILGFASLGTTMPLDAKPLDYFRRIGRAGQALMGIINDVLDFSKIEAGRMELESIPFRLSDTLAQLSDLFSLKAMEKQLELEIIAEDGVPEWLNGDPLRLNQVLINLSGNAVKFTSQGWIRVRVGLAPGETPNPPPGARTRLRFTVEDSGVGITKDNQERLFQAFAQGDASTTRMYGGTGLGLAISQQLVQRMGGTIRVESATGVGSSFTFDLDFTCAMPQVEPVEDLEEVSASLRGARILVVDDNTMNLQLAAEMLEDAGAVAELASNGSDAIRMASETSYDAVLMDIQMPVMNGYEATARIRMAPGNLDLPIIAMTAHAVAGYREECLARGMNDFITKPARPQQLYALLAAWIRRVPAA